MRRRFFYSSFFSLLFCVSLIVSSVTLGNAQIISTVATGLNQPNGVAIDKKGNIYIADWGDNVVEEMNIKTHTLKIIAGQLGKQGVSSGYGDGDGGPATAALLYLPRGIAIDTFGNIYIADQSRKVRKINNLTGIITTIAGNGNYGDSGDGGPATAAEIRSSYGVSLDDSGNVYIVDYLSFTIRKVTAVTGTINTVAGNDTVKNFYSGDGGPATAAGLSNPTGVCIDDSGNIYIADYGNNVIREVTYSTGIITTIVGNPTGGYSGDGGPATAAELSRPPDLVIDTKGNLYISDDNHIRKVNLSTKIISTYAGDTINGYSGDGGPATDALLNLPWGIAIDDSDNVYIADSYNNVIRKVSKDTVTGNNNLFIKCNVNVFPNPSTGLFSIIDDSHHLTTNNSIEIFNIFGEKVLYRQCIHDNSKIIIDIRNQPAGVYLYRILNNSGKQLSAGKVILQ